MLQTACIIAAVKLECNCFQFASSSRGGGRESGRFSRGGKTVYFNEDVYLEIVEKRIISAYTMAKADQRISASIATVELVPEGTGTRVAFTGCLSGHAATAGNT